MSQKWLSLSLLLMLMPAFAFAEDTCSSKDYTSELGPIRDQGDTGWCFAYTAADMLTQKLRKTNPLKFANIQVSALDVTFQYLQNRTTPMVIPRSDSAYWKLKVKKREDEKLRMREEDIAKNPILDRFAGGFIDIAIHTYKDQDLGVCSESDLPSEKGLTKEIMTAVNQKVLDASLDCAATQPNMNLKDIAQLRNKVWSYVIEKRCHRQLSGITKWVKTMDSAVYDSGTKEDGTFQFWTEDESGTSKIDVTQDVRQSLKSAVDQGLDHGSIVGIGIAPSFLMNDQVKDKMLREHARHEVSIVAREKRDNQCFYRIRNSWGKSCDMYNTKFKKRCSGGYIWVTDSELLPYMGRAHYLE